MRFGMKYPKAVLSVQSSLVGKTKRCFIKLNSLNYSMSFILSDIFKTLFSRERSLLDSFSENFLS